MAKRPSGKQWFEKNKGGAQEESVVGEEDVEDVEDYKVELEDGENEDIEDENDEDDEEYQPDT